MSKYGPAAWFFPHGWDPHPTGKVVPGWPRWRKRELFEIELHPRCPLTFWSDRRQRFIRPDRHFYSEFASIPECLRSFIGVDDFKRSAVLHDSTCQDHQTAPAAHVIYESAILEGVFLPVVVDSVEACALLREGVEAERLQIYRDSPLRARATAALVWSGVTVGGPRF